MIADESGSACDHYFFVIEFCHVNHDKGYIIIWYVVMVYVTVKSHKNL